LAKHYPFTLEPLPYDYDALVPYIDARTLHFHHDKHLQTYVDNLNKALENYPEYHDCSLEDLLLQNEELPDEIRTAVKNNAGGVYNHELYFACMGKVNHSMPSGALLDAINESFGSFDQWKEEMKAAALAQFGSGWAYLVEDEDAKLSIVKTPNQDTPLPMGLKPVVLVDVWEHAYYLQYQNRRAEYVDNWFATVDWDAVALRLTKA
jgi:Fe-Mn family superoxide dismutase